MAAAKVVPPLSVDIADLFTAREGQTAYRRKFGKLGVSSQRGYAHIRAEGTLVQELHESTCWEGMINSAAHDPGITETLVFVTQTRIEPEYSYDDVLRYCDNLKLCGINVSVSCPSVDVMPKQVRRPSTVPPLPIASCSYCMRGHTSEYCLHWRRQLDWENQAWAEQQAAAKKRKPVYGFRIARADNTPTAIRMAIHLTRFFAEAYHYRIPALFNKYMSEDDGGLAHNKLLAACQHTYRAGGHSFHNPCGPYATMTQAEWEKFIGAKEDPGQVGVRTFYIPSTCRVKKFDTYLKKDFYSTDYNQELSEAIPTLANYKGDLTYAEVFSVWERMMRKYGVWSQDRTVSAGMRVVRAAQAEEAVPVV